MASVSRRSWAAVASVVTCAARSSAGRLSFAFCKAWAAWRASSALWRVSSAARSATSLPWRSWSRSVSAWRRADWAAAISARSCPTSACKAPSVAASRSCSVLLSGFGSSPRIALVRSLSAQASAHGFGTRTRVRPSFPRCRAQRCPRISRLAEPELILRNAASSALVIHTPSAISAGRFIGVATCSCLRSRTARSLTRALRFAAGDGRNFRYHIQEYLPNSGSDPPTTHGKRLTISSPNPAHR